MTREAETKKKWQATGVCKMLNEDSEQFFNAVSASAVVEQEFL